MEWLGLHFFTDLPESGHLLLNCSHNPFLVLLAYLVACAAGFGTLDMAERVGHVEKPTAQRHWRWLGAGCLAGGIWSTHFIRLGSTVTVVPLTQGADTLLEKVR